MLLDELAKELVEVTSSLVGGRTINVMDTEGIIVASTEAPRIGTFHQGAREAALTGKPVTIRRDQLEATFGPEECRGLLLSIRTYYECDRSVGTAAQKLFIHKNTLQYRIRRVLEVLELTKLPSFWQEYLLRLLAGRMGVT